MPRFEPITLQYQGDSYEVTPDRVWGLLATLEEYLVLADVMGMINQSRMKPTAVVTAFRAALVYAGAKNLPRPEDIAMGLEDGELEAMAWGLFYILLEGQPSVKKKVLAAGNRTSSKSKGKTTEAKE